MTNAPKAPKQPVDIVRHGDVRVDPYYWMMDRSDEVLEHLRAENDFTAASLAPLRELEEEIFADMKARIEETDTSLPVRRGQWWYFERTREGLNYPIWCRVPVAGDLTTPPTVDADAALENEVVILDENLEAQGHDFLSVGVLAVSPDDTWLALAVDVEGHERHRMSFRSLAGARAPDEVIEDVYYGVAWSADSRHLFYVRVDDAMRPFQVWRHELGTDPGTDALVYQEDDPEFFVSVDRSRDNRVVLISCGSKTTSETLFLPADQPLAPAVSVAERRHGIEYGVDHWNDSSGDGWWIKISNEGATDFFLSARRVTDETSGWSVLIPERPGQRLDGVEAFSHCLLVSERSDGCAALRMIPLAGSHDLERGDLLERSSLIPGPATPSSVVAGDNANFETDMLRIVTTSMIHPRNIIDIDIASGDQIVRKVQKVKGAYRPDDYTTGRLWVTASDGERVPVTVVARRELLAVAGDELSAVKASPFMLYGYGSYETCIDPSFSALRLALLDRGVIMAVAHVRGGGEMGRSWYEMGKMAQKATTFSDFVAVARYLIDTGWTTPEQLAARGASAGGLLMGAVMNAAPDLFRCVVAEVPFVDVVTTMLDASLPLTIGEWEEWGNPDASATAYRIMKGYSPYDNIRSHNDDGTVRVYPELYATAGLNDSRVGFWEPAKWVQKLRDANPENLVYLKTEMGAGHGGPSGRYDSWRDEAQVYAFIVSRTSGAN